MILDNERQREIILQLIKTSQFTGDLVDEVYEFKKQVGLAEIGERYADNYADEATRRVAPKIIEPGP